MCWLLVCNAVQCRSRCRCCICQKDGRVDYVCVKLLLEFDLRMILHRAVLQISNWHGSLILRVVTSRWARQAGLGVLAAGM